MVMLGNRGLETAEANGDTRTLSLHHLHTDENITITYKRDGRYDDDALKKLDHFLRDWRKDESTHMDPRLYDVIWEVSREFGKDKVIQVVCGYRSPSTNEMLRHRSRNTGVAQFSQHTLGKAMDFYIQGASLEEIREAGLRLQRGGVGYYPTSGSPFVHLDVGSVRHWPRMTREQLVRVFPNGRTVHIPSDGQPLPGYAQALADIQKRGSSPSQMSLASAQSAGIDTSSAGHSRNFLASLFRADDEEDDKPQPAPSTASRTYSLASVSDTKASETRPATVPVPPPRPQRVPLAAVVGSTGSDGGVAPAERDPWATAGLVEAQRPSAGISHAPLSNPDSAPAPAPWPYRDDRVPLDMVLAYAEPQRDGGSDFNSRFAAVGRQAAATAATLRSVTAHDKAPDRNASEARKSPPPGPPQGPARTAADNIPLVKVVVVTAEAGMRYDDPWLRAMILAPRLYGSMTTTSYGDADMTELRWLMSKPATAVAMSFSNEPYPGIMANSFSGNAVVPLATIAFPQRTASLQR